MIRLAKQVKRYLFEDVLPGNVDDMKFDASVRLSFNGNILDSVLTSLCHHVVMVEVLSDKLMDDLCLSNSWLTCNYDS